MSEWIDISKEQPKKRKEYLAWQPETTAMGHVIEERYSILKWNGKKFYSSFPITHWMPLPEPPK